MAAKTPKKATASPPKQPVVIEGEVVPGSEGIEQGITIVNASDGEVVPGSEGIEQGITIVNASDGEVVPGSEGIEQGITIVNASDGEVAAGGEQSPLVDELVSCVLLTSLASVNQSWRCGDLYQDTAENVERLISLGMASPHKGE